MREDQNNDVPQQPNFGASQADLDATGRWHATRQLDQGIVVTPRVLGTTPSKEKTIKLLKGRRRNAHQLHPPRLVDAVNAVDLRRRVRIVIEEFHNLVRGKARVSRAVELDDKATGERKRVGSIGLWHEGSSLCGCCVPRPSR